MAFLAGVFGANFVVGTDDVSSSVNSAGQGSLYGTILEVLPVLVPRALEPETTRRVRPAFFSVVPAAF